MESNSLGIHSGYCNFYNSHNLVYFYSASIHSAAYTELAGKKTDKRNQTFNATRESLQMLSQVREEL